MATAQPDIAMAQKPTVIGLYGVPGSGKTFLLKQLKELLHDQGFLFFDGSSTIAGIVPGGLDAFHSMSSQDKIQWRQIAISTIGQESASTGKTAVVAGHLIFWSEDEDAGQLVHTSNDLDTFTHILYLNVDADVIAQRRSNDGERHRPSASVSHLHKWQQAEIRELRILCRDHSILFAAVDPFPSHLSTLLRDFRVHNVDHNLSRAEEALDEVFDGHATQLETMLVIDADRTLAGEDGGTLFWEKISSSGVGKATGLGEAGCPLKALFGGPLGYTYAAFRQATLLHHEVASDDDAFDAFCRAVASEITMYPDFVALLQAITNQASVGAVVVTCGIKRIWDLVLDKQGLTGKVKVIGGGRVTDGFVVTPEVKAALVSRLQDIHGVFVWVFGDSPLDLPMMKIADRATVIVGDERFRSKTMDVALLKAIDVDGLKVDQAILAPDASPRLDLVKLPVTKLRGEDFVASILSLRAPRSNVVVLEATNKAAAKVLMTPMRDARISGPALREAHRQVGWYLAVEYLGDLIGIESHPIPHVQGHDTDGFRLSHEQKTLIIALMRGGEPMALGVNDACPSAMLLHARRSEDVTAQHLHGKRTVLLVDSVVNSGKSVLEFVQRIRRVNAQIRIVIVAGVAQSRSVDALSRYKDLSLVTLRISDNQFTGRGTTDTGNRLFNTTHIP